MICHGKLKLVSDSNVRLDMGVQVVGNTTNCDLQGSMTTLLGHYMVLGTANSRFVEGGAAGGRPIVVGRMGMAGGPAGPGAFVPAGPGGGPGMGPGGAFGAAPLDPNAAAPGAEPPSAKPSYTMSRFAFVVQVVEGESYEAEKPKGK